MISASKKEFIEFMMSADVLRFGEFKTKSGRLSPYFVNTGNYKTGAQISTLGKFYAQCIMEHCGENFDAMFGPHTRAFRLQLLQQALLQENTTWTNHTSLTVKKQKTTVKAATWLAISQKTATASSSSRTLSLLEPQFVKPFRFCRTLQK